MGKPTTNSGVSDSSKPNLLKCGDPPEQPYDLDRCLAHWLFGALSEALSSDEGRRSSVRRRVQSSGGGSKVEEAGPKLRRRVQTC